MNKVPEMISTKDLMYISDMFNWHLTSAKKFEQYSALVEDKTCSKKLTDLCKMHYDVCESLVELLERGNK